MLRFLKCGIIKGVFGEHGGIESIYVPQLSMTISLEPENMEVKLAHSIGGARQNTAEI